MKHKVLIEYTNPFNGTRVVEWVSYDQWNLIERLTEVKLLSLKSTEK